MTITQELVKEYFGYINNEFVWIKTHKKSKKLLNKKAGCFDHHDGYYKLSINKKSYPMHHIIWLWHTGKMPDEEIDHIDGNSANNEISNLRECTRQQNSFNRGLGKNNKSGHKGVSWAKESGKWYVCLKVNGKNKNLGYYESLLDAAKVYETEAKKIHGEFARFK